MSEKRKQQNGKELKEKDRVAKGSKGSERGERDSQKGKVQSR